MRRIAAVILTVLVAFAAAASASADNAFYRVLAVKPNATFEDAVRAFYELVTGQAAAEDATFQTLAEALVERKIIRSDWTSDANVKLTRGRAAYMICRVCDIKGGVTMRVFGPSERYCFRECVFLGVWPGGNQRDLMTGGELMGVLAWAADYTKGN
jgi:hypothetical protein